MGRCGAFGQGLDQPGRELGGVGVVEEFVAAVREHGAGCDDVPTLGAGVHAFRAVDDSDGQRGTAGMSMDTRTSGDKHLVPDAVMTGLREEQGWGRGRLERNLSWSPGAK